MSGGDCEPNSLAEISGDTGHENLAPAKRVGEDSCGKTIAPRQALSLPLRRTDVG